MASLRVGLTGGLASGKSTVAGQLAAAGCAVFDADQLVRELYEPGAAGSRAVRALFGEAPLAPDGSVDRPWVAGHVFSDPAARRQLEASVHPLVREAFRVRAEACEGIAVLEATKLVEAGYGPDFDLVVTVEAPLETRLRRAVARGLTEREAKERLAAQAEATARRAAADWVIENDGAREHLALQVGRLVAELRRRAGAHGP